MNILNKVTLKTLKRNKTRTIVTIIGTVLSAAMICAVTTFASSFQGYMLDMAIYQNGDWYGSAVNISSDKLSEIKQAPQIKAAAVSRELGYARVDDIVNTYKPYVYVMGADESFCNMMPVHIISGRLPQRESEIILPEHLASDGGVDFALNGSVTFNVGQRTGDGGRLFQNNPYDPDYPEEIVGVSERTYTVVGIYERPGFEDYSAPGYTVITVMPDTEPGGSGYDVFFKLKDHADIYDFMAEHELGGSTNWEVLAYMGVSRFNSFYSVLYSIAAIVIALIIFGSVSLIYNAFAISVSERTKQFGLMSSIGATKRQIRRSVLFESLVVSSIGIPVGVICGIGGIGVTLYLLRQKLQIFTASDLPMRLTVSAPSVIIACIIALLTVLISAWIPSRRAMRISAVDAIRLSNDIRVKPGSVKTSKLTYKLFGFEGALAKKHFKRNRKSYRATVISLFMSIVLFISASSFCLYLTESIEGPFSSADYDISYYYTRQEGSTPWEDIYSELRQAEGVTTSIAQKLRYSAVSFTARDCSKEYKDYLLSIGQVQDGNDFEDQTGSICLAFLEDKAYASFLKDNGLDKDRFMDAAQPPGVLYDSNTRFNYDEGKYHNFAYLSKDASEVKIVYYKELEGYLYNGEETDQSGNTVIIYEKDSQDTPGEQTLRVPAGEAQIESELAIGARVDELPFSVWEEFAMIYPMSAYESVSGRGSDDIVSMCFLSSDHGATFKQMKQILASNGLGSHTLIDFAEQQEGSRSTVFVVKVFSYGFIVLISLIAMANVFNTISTNIGLRRREFAMLKSVGMTQRGFNKMMNFECVLYGLRSLVSGLPVSFALTYLIYRAVNQGYMTSYYLPWGSVGIAVLSVFAIVFISMIYSMSRIKKDNPIDALKNENL